MYFFLWGISGANARQPAHGLFIIQEEISFKADKIISKVIEQLVHYC